MKRVVLLGGSRLQVPAILAAKELGFYVICADYDPEAIGFCHADEWSLTSTMDVDAVESLARRVNADYVITSTSDAPVRTAALVSERLGLPTGISYENARCATYKDEMRLRLESHSVPMPRFEIVSTLDDFKKALDHFSHTCVAKPADSSASRGVRLIDGQLSPAELSGLYRELVGFSKRGVLMVEERMLGHEVSVEGMTVAGETTILSVTDKMVTEPPFFVELGHCEPSQLPTAAVSQIEEVALKTIEAIGIISGPSHTEIMLTQDGPKVVETAARLGGDFITSRLVPLSTGVNLVKGSVAVALGLAYDFTPNMQRGASIRFITSEKKGTIVSIEGIEEAKALKGVEEVELYLNIGDSIDSPQSSGDRIGHVVASSDTAERASVIAMEALGMIQILVE